MILPVFSFNATITEVALKQNKTKLGRSYPSFQSAVQIYDFRLSINIICPFCDSLRGLEIFQGIPLNHTPSLFKMNIMVFLELLLFEYADLLFLSISQKGPALVNQQLLPSITI